MAPLSVKGRRRRQQQPLHSKRVVHFAYRKLQAAAAQWQQLSFCRSLLLCFHRRTAALGRQHIEKKKKKQKKQKQKKNRHL